MYETCFHGFCVLKGRMQTLLTSVCFSHPWVIWAEVSEGIYLFWSGSRKTTCLQHQHKLTTKVSSQLKYDMINIPGFNNNTSQVVVWNFWTVSSQLVSGLRLKHAVQQVVLVGDSNAGKSSLVGQRRKNVQRDKCDVASRLETLLI